MGEYISIASLFLSIVPHKIVRLVMQDGITHSISFYLIRSQFSEFIPEARHSCITARVMLKLGLVENKGVQYPKVL